MSNKFITEILVNASEYESDEPETYFISMEVTTTLKETSLYYFLTTVLLTEDFSIEEKYEELSSDIYQTIYNKVIKINGWDDCELCVIDDVNTVDAVDKLLPDDVDEEGEPNYSYKYDELEVTPQGTLVDGEMEYESEFLHDASVIIMIK